MAPRYTEAQAREAIAASRSYSEALRHMGKCCTGSSAEVFKKWVRIWNIPTDHFDPWAAAREALAAHRGAPRPLREILVAGSRFNRTDLKRRLYTEGLKERRCEMCGQGEEWRGKPMTLILDHINGVSDDNRLENLRIVCPNCNATLDTHCGRNATVLADVACERCGTTFRKKYARQRFCSRACGMRHDRSGQRNEVLRRVERPPYAQLLAEVEQLGWVGTGRKYGVSDNAVRKWVRFYEAERRRLEDAA